MMPGAARPESAEVEPVVSLKSVFSSSVGHTSFQQIYNVLYYMHHNCPPRNKTGERDHFKATSAQDPGRAS
jgi:hypothetical protein